MRELAGFLVLVVVAGIALYARPRDAHKYVGAAPRRFLKAGMVAASVGAVGLPIALFGLVGSEFLLQASKGALVFGGLLMLYGYVKRLLIEHDSRRDLSDW